MSTLREQILNSNDLPREKIVVKEWAEDALYVRALTAAERDDFEASCLEEKKEKGKTVAKVNMQNLRAKLVARSLVDETGNRVFGDEDIALLGKKSAAVVNRLFEIAQRLSGLTEDDVDELIKN